MSSKVLVADDELNLCKVLSARLAQRDLQCVIAHDGLRALEIIRTEPVDAAVLDIRLPRMDGIQVLREIRKEHPDLPCVLITAYDDVQLHEEAVRLGANAVLQKPFDLDAFTDLLWRLISALGRQMLLETGEKVLVDIRRGEWSYTYTPRVIAQDDRSLEIEPPLGMLGEEALSRGVAVVQFTRGDGVYQFRSRFRLTAAPRPALQVAKPVAIRRLQRREHPRARESGQVTLGWYARQEREEVPQTLNGDLYDISLGGFSCLVPRTPPVGEEVSFQIVLPEGNLTIFGQARVVRVGGVVAERIPAEYRVGLEFTKLSPAMRQALADWVERLLKRV